MPEAGDPETIAFMQQVMAGIGVTRRRSSRTCSSEKGCSITRKARKVFRWARGESAPNNKATLMLLRRAGLLED